MIELIPYYWAVMERLNRVLGPNGYSYHMDIQSAGPYHVVTCHLRIGGITRAGVCRCSLETPHGHRALVRAAQRFHVGWQAHHLGLVTVKAPVDFSNLPEWVPRRLQGEGLTSHLIWAEDEEENGNPFEGTSS